MSTSFDCLIIQTAIDNNLYPLHRDGDYENARKVIAFKVYPS